MEQWKPVVEFDDYEVSDLGNVRSTKRGSPRLLKPGKSGTNGEYRCVYLSKDSKVYPKLVHRLMLEAFVGPCPDGHETRHVNGVAFDNRLENLEWATHMDNMQDKIAHGTLNRNRASGEDCNFTRLTANQVRSIRIKYATGRITQQELANLYQTSRSNIGLIVNRKNWKKV